MQSLYSLHIKDVCIYHTLFFFFFLLGMLVAAGCEICRYAEGKGPEEDATTSDESLEYSRSQYGAALPDRLYL